MAMSIRKNDQVMVRAGKDRGKKGRVLSVDVLREREKELDDQLFRLRIQKSMGQLEAPGKMRTIRRERARILTILKEKAK